MAQAKSCPKLIWKILNDTLWRKSKLIDIKQLIDENRINKLFLVTSKLLWSSKIALLISVTLVVKNVLIVMLSRIIWPTLRWANLLSFWLLVQNHLKRLLVRSKNRPLGTLKSHFSLLKSSSIYWDLLWYKYAIGP